MTDRAMKNCASYARDHVVIYDEVAGKWRPVTSAGRDYEQFAIHVWRLVRAIGDTKTRKSRRTIALPRRCAIELRTWRVSQADGLSKAARKAAPGTTRFRLGTSGKCRVGSRTRAVSPARGLAVATSSR